MHQRLYIFVLTLCLASFSCLHNSKAFAQDGDSVLLLTNRKNKDSGAIAEHYSELRSVPKKQILALTCSEKEEISRAEFDESIAKPLRAYLKENPQILIVIPCYGVPLKIKDQDPKDNAAIKAGYFGGRDNASVDGEIALFRRTGHKLPAAIQNPVFNKSTAINKDDKILIVCRLDGPTPELANRLVDKAILAEALGPKGQSFLDTRGPNLKGGYKVRDDIMVQVARSWKKLGLAFDHDVKPAVLDLSTRSDTLHYYGWYAGSQKPKKAVRFRTGSIAIHLHSFSASTIRRPNKNWVGPLLSWNATASYGTVYEPLTVGFPYEQVFWDRLAQGWSFGQAGQCANKLLSWQAVFVGDPLYTPYPKSSNHEATRKALNNTLGQRETSHDPDPILVKALPLYRALFQIIKSRMIQITAAKDDNQALKLLNDFQFLIKDFGLQAVLKRAQEPFKKNIEKAFIKLKSTIKKDIRQTQELEQRLIDWGDWDIYPKLCKYRDEISKKQDKSAAKLLKKAKSAKSSKFYLSAWLLASQVGQHRLSKHVKAALELQNQINADSKAHKRLLKDCQRKAPKILKKAKKAQSRKQYKKARDLLKPIVELYPDCEQKKQAAKLLADVVKKI
jgi:uncharacterized protein (TIGR03790 family)